MRFSQFAAIAKTLFEPRQRRASVGVTRAHIEYRPIRTAEGFKRFEQEIDRISQETNAIKWAEINPYANRVVFAYLPGGVDRATLQEWVETAERYAGMGPVEFDEAKADHPADDEPIVRLWLELATDAVGLFVGSSLAASPVPNFSIAGNTVAVISILQSVERLRSPLTSRLGKERTEMLLNLSSALAKGVAQRPATSLVDITHRFAQLREALARQQAFLQREEELCGDPVGFHLDDAHLPSRPVPSPRGPIEEYADRAVFVSLGGFALSFATTRSFQRAVAALFGGLPKPARLGREVFGSELTRVLASRGVVVREPEALRRLDRVDCLVLQGDLVARQKFILGDVLPADQGRRAELRKRAAELFDADDPIEIRRDGSWALGPYRLLDAPMPEKLQKRATGLSQGGALVLALAHERQVQALILVRVVPQTGVEELIQAAHKAQIEVVIAGGEEQDEHSLLADSVILESEGLRAGIRRLQREGRCVCMVATGRSPGLPVADVGIGLTRKDEATPWGAHLICQEDLSDVRFLLEACLSARRLAKQAVNISLAAATMGALVSAGGILPMTTRRVFFVVNSATMVSMANGLRSSFALERRALPPPRDPTPWHALDATGVMARLRTATEGLAKRDVGNRKRRHIAPRSAALELTEAITDELFNPLAPLLAAGAGLSAVVGSTSDAAMVGAVVVLNALVGGVQRFRTERAIQDLAKVTPRSALVIREGRAVTIDAKELVHGDMIVLHAGDVVPADCRIISAHALEVDASSLTGESMPVRKQSEPSFERHVADRQSMLFEDTTIAAGRATAVVVAVGDETEARRGAERAKRSRASGGVEERLRSLMNLTGPVALGAGAGLVSAGLLRGRKLSELVDAGVSLAVGSVPEGLPLLATAAQLAASRRLSQRGALVRNVRSVEAIGRVDTICVDKTGTVTEGRLAVQVISDGFAAVNLDQAEEPLRSVLAAALRATPVQAPPSGKADPLDQALRRAATRVDCSRGDGEEGWSPRTEVPFEARRAYHAVMGETQDGAKLYVKGAAEVLLTRSSYFWRDGQRLAMGEDDLDVIAAKSSELATHGLRVLAVARKAADSLDELNGEELEELELMGLLACSDPVRPAARSAIADLGRAGVQTVMITGDHPSTAQSIAREVGLTASNIMTGAEIADLIEEELDARVAETHVFARVTPSQKVKIVRSLQRLGRVVAMVGDGANDAPAIRLADVGIALGERSTAAARRAADIVITDERMETLVSAVSEGRAMWAAVRDAVSILVGGNLGEIGFTLGAGLVEGKSPLNARQLLLVNLLTDVAPAMAIALRPPTEETLEALANEGPDQSMGSALVRDIAGRAVVTSLGAGGAWAVGKLTGSSARARTIGLTALVGTQLGQTLASGGYNWPVVATSVGSAALMAGIVQTPGVSQFFGCQPLGPIGWATAVTASVAATSAAVAFPEYVERLGLRVTAKAVENAPANLAQGVISIPPEPASESTDIAPLEEEPAT